MIWNHNAVSFYGLYNKISFAKNCSLIFLQIWFNTQHLVFSFIYWPYVFMSTLTNCAKALVNFKPIVILKLERNFETYFHNKSYLFIIIIMRHTILWTRLSCLILIHLNPKIQYWKNCKNITLSLAKSFMVHHFKYDIINP